MKQSDEDLIVRPVARPWHQPFLLKLLSLKQQQRLPHALLIDARSRLDGAEFIWHLAMLLLCRNNQNSMPCGNCSSCNQMLLNLYPDFHFVTVEYDEKTKKPNKNIKIEQIRKLIHEVHLSHRLDNLKIAAIYPAEKMSIAGANSLLKTLEEPSDNTLIVVMTHNMGKLPVTVRSRCQVWPLDHPASNIALDWLQQQGLNEEKAQQYIDYADGDPQLAQKLQQENYAGIVADFKQQFTLYMKNSIDVTRLCTGLTKHEPGLIRRLVKMVIEAYCLQMCGVNAPNNQGNVINKKGGQALLALAIQAESQLQVEDNNLNLQLQLEDVLISLKQIIVRSS